MIYVNPKGFSEETRNQTRAQIDASLLLGWDLNDLILATNFDYEYQGVKSIVVDDDTYCPFFPQASKINVIIYLINNGHIENGMWHWFHDLDAYQQGLIKEDDIDSVGDAVAVFGKACHCYGWSTASFFFKHEAKDIFERIRELTYIIKDNEEKALAILAGQTNNMGGKLAVCGTNHKVQHLFLVD